MIWLRKLANKDLKLICFIKSDAKFPNSGTSLHFPIKNEIFLYDENILKRSDPVLYVIKELRADRNLKSQFRLRKNGAAKAEERPKLRRIQ